MFVERKYFYTVIWLLSVIFFPTIVGHVFLGLPISKKLQDLTFIMQKKSWRWNPSVTDSLVYRGMDFKGNLSTFVGLVGIPSEINESNLTEITTSMYIVLRCEGAEIIRAIMNDTLTMWSDSLTEDQNMITEDLIEINRVILKTVDVLMNFSEIAPDVLPLRAITLLKMSLRFNLFINNMLNRINNASHNLNPFLENFKMILLQMINLTERFIFLNCSVKRLNRGDSTEVLKNTKWCDKETIKNIIDKFDVYLKDTGLSTKHYFKYNLNYKMFLNNQTDHKDYDDLSAIKFLEFNMIKDVSNQLNLLFKIQCFYPSLEDIDLDDILSYQKNIFDLIYFIVYRKTYTYLTILRKENNSQQTKQTEINDEQSISESLESNINYFNEFYINGNQLLLFYKRLYARAVSLQFPTEFIDHIILIRRLLKDIIWEGKITDVENLKGKMKIYSHNISKRTFFLQNKNIDLQLILENTKNYELHTFLWVILSMKSIKYFNQIFNLEEFKDPDELSEAIMQYKESLNIIEINIDTNNLTTKMVGEEILSVYKYCFKILLEIGNRPILNHFLTQEMLIERFYNIDFALNDTIHHEKQRGGNRIDLLLYARYYLDSIVKNIKNKTANILPDKIYRTLNFITNLVDKYQMYNYRSPKYRNSLYIEFDNMLWSIDKLEYKSPIQFKLPPNDNQDDCPPTDNMCTDNYSVPPLYFGLLGAGAMYPYVDPGCSDVLDVDMNDDMDDGYV
ncbi:Hypothetical protein CINCED_3A010033 [Cinara cedri]|uniref:Uncharacterized protein n=1 Tax=Cinara cedri TaxID=506608 RepID=A0A5E4N2G8_9HEMI|nr:Hypothetical protein CINCED_3A010033 [Cinara cedri]